MTFELSPANSVDNEQLSPYTGSEKNQGRHDSKLASNS